MKKISLTILTLFFATLTYAQELCPLDGSTAKRVENLDALKYTAVLENGRIKPIDTYAQNILLQFSGRRSFEKKPAIHWLAKLFFAPGQTREEKVFLINNPVIAHALGIEEDKHRRYSFAQLESKFPKLSELAQTALQIDPKQRDIVENEIIRVYENMILYSKLSVNFVFAFPNPDFSIEDTNTLKTLELNPNAGQQLTFMDIAINADKLQGILQPLEKLPENQWNASQTEVVRIVNNLYQWQMSYQGLPF